MSKFIKVHLSYYELLTGKEEVMYIRADRIERLMNKTTECGCLLKVEGTETPYGVDESVDEVMRLIAKAEGKTEEKSRLAEFLLAETYLAKKMMKESDEETYNYQEGRRDAFKAVYEFLVEPADTEEENEE